jgi:hypothetical protein
MQTLAAVGMTAAYMHEQRRGFSTFELDLTLVGEATSATLSMCRTSFSHLGNSSLRFAHAMTGPGGREIAFLVQSGVHLDYGRTSVGADTGRAARFDTKLLIRDT